MQKFCEEGTYTGVLRGSDSTGCFQVKRENKGISIVKLPIEGGYFLGNARVRRIYNDINETFCTVIHHRAATKGSVSADNAHPFHHQTGKRGIVGVHNGTLWGSYPLELDGQKFEVDSDYLMARILKDGGPKALGDVSGAWAVVWYETDGKMRIAVNKERPLCWAYVKGRDQMVFASEPGMLWWLCQRNGIRLEEEGIIVPEVDKIYTFDILNKNVRDFEVEDIAKKTYTHYRPANNVAPYNGGFERRPLELEKSSGTESQPVGLSTNNTRPRLEDLGIKKDELLPFVYTGESNGIAVEGAVDINGKTFAAKIWHGINRNLIDRLQECEYAMCPVDLVYWDHMKKEVCVQLGKPKELIISSERVIAEKVEPTEVKAKLTKPIEAPLEGEELGEHIQKAFADLEDDFPPKHIDVIRGPSGRLLRRSTFLKMTEDGCMQCGGFISEEDANNEEIVWVNNDQNALCARCTVEQAELQRHAKQGGG